MICSFERAVFSRKHNHAALCVLLNTKSVLSLAIAINGNFCLSGFLQHFDVRSNIMALNITNCDSQRDFTQNTHGFCIVTFHFFEPVFRCIHKIVQSDY